jgi:hypothetical protein
VTGKPLRNERDVPVAHERWFLTLSRSALRLVALFRILAVLSLMQPVTVMENNAYKKTLRLALYDVFPSKPVSSE